MAVHRRKSESAESDLAFPVPKLLLRFLCSAGVGLLAGMVFYLVSTSTVSFFFGFLFFSIMAHAVTEALYSRGLKRFVRTLPLIWPWCSVWWCCTVPRQRDFSAMPHTCLKLSSPLPSRAGIRQFWKYLGCRPESHRSAFRQQSLSKTIAVRDQVTYKDPSTWWSWRKFRKCWSAAGNRKTAPFIPTFPAAP